MKALAVAVFATCAFAYACSTPPRVLASGATPVASAQGPSRCVIEGSGEPEFCASHFDVYASATGGEPLLVVARPHDVRVRWSALPEVGRGTRAKVTLGGDRLVRFEGFASLKDRDFRLKRRYDVVPDHIWVRAASSLEVVGGADGAVAVRVLTPFDDPESLLLFVRCEDVIYAKNSPRSVDDGPLPGSAYAFPARRTIRLFDRARGRSVYSFRASLPLAWLGRREGFVHVSGGDPVVVDGWVAEADVRKDGDYTPDRDSTGDCTDTTDECDPVLLADAPLVVGRDPSGAGIGVVEKGAVVRVVERRGDNVAFTFEREAIEAPKGATMWMKTPALSGTGCPPP